MKIKINKDGHLEIERAGEFKKQVCPYNTQQFCGDQCPLFGTPHEQDPSEGSAAIVLAICQKAFVVLAKDFTDGRAVGE